MRHRIPAPNLLLLQPLHDPTLPAFIHQVESDFSSIEKYPPQRVAFQSNPHGSGRRRTYHCSPSQALEVACPFRWRNLVDPFGFSARQRSDADPVRSPLSSLFGADHCDLVSIRRDGEQAKLGTFPNNGYVLLNFIAQTPGEMRARSFRTLSWNISSD